MLRANPEKREEKERVRQALLRAALRLGAQHGFSSLGLREVSRAAAIAPTSFYRHFADMSELGLALVRELVNPLVLSLVVRAREAGALSEALVDELLGAVINDAELVRFVVSERTGAFASLRKGLAAEFEMLTKVLRATDPSARTGWPQVAEAAVALLLEGFARALDTEPAERAELRDSLVATLMLVLGTPSARGDEHA